MVHLQMVYLLKMVIFLLNMVIYHGKFSWEIPWTWRVWLMGKGHQKTFTRPGYD